MQFLDEAKVYLSSGAGGKGCASFRREKYIEFGGPDGGDGGRGGDVFAESVDGLNTLVDFRFRQHAKAKNGRPGMGRDRSGADGDDMVIKVPAGTEIIEIETETLIADFPEVGMRKLLLSGGNGGFGNTHFKSSTNRAPRRANSGLPGQEMRVRLRLKLIADAGLVGLPNAGKSTFLSVVSRARPKIANYPFTTRIPQLGVAYIDGSEFVLADIPGLIEGAHSGTGLGDQFLRHIERCRVLLHLVDGTLEDPVAAFHTIQAELGQYGHGLADKPMIVALNKCDALDAAAAAELAEAIGKAAGAKVLQISAATGAGKETALRRLWRTITESRTRETVAEQPAPAPWRP